MGNGMGMYTMRYTKDVLSINNRIYFGERDELWYKLWVLYYSYMNNCLKLWCIHYIQPRIYEYDEHLYILAILVWTQGITAVSYWQSSLTPAHRCWSSSSRYLLADRYTSVACVVSMWRLSRDVKSVGLHRVLTHIMKNRVQTTPWPVAAVAMTNDFMSTTGTMKAGGFINGVLGQSSSNVWGHRTATISCQLFCKFNRLLVWSCICMYVYIYIHIYINTYLLRLIVNKAKILANIYNSGI